MNLAHDRPDPSNAQSSKGKNQHAKCTKAQNTRKEPRKKNHRSKNPRPGVHACVSVDERPADRPASEQQPGVAEARGRPSASLPSPQSAELSPPRRSPTRALALRMGRGEGGKGKAEWFSFWILYPWQKLR